MALMAQRNNALDVRSPLRHDASSPTQSSDADSSPHNPPHAASYNETYVNHNVNQSTSLLQTSCSPSPRRRHGHSSSSSQFSSANRSPVYLLHFLTLIFLSLELPYDKLNPAFSSPAPYSPSRVRRRLQSSPWFSPLSGSIFEPSSTPSNNAPSLSHSDDNSRLLGIKDDNNHNSHQTNNDNSKSNHQLPSLLSAYLYGGIHDYAYYFIDVLVGTPPQRQSVIVDSGSSLLGFPCSSCITCGKTHIDRGFDFGASETSKWLPCHDARCFSSTVCSAPDLTVYADDPTIDHGTHKERCSYSQSYSEGSSIAGNYFSDYVAIGDQDRNNAFVKFDYIGCHHKETNLFTSQKASGIMGVAYPKGGRQKTIIDALFSAPTVDTKVFSLCLAEEGGLMTVGGYNSSLHRPSRTKGGQLASMRKLAAQQVHDRDVVLRRRLLEAEENGQLEGGDLSAEGNRSDSGRGGRSIGDRRELWGLFAEDAKPSSNVLLNPSSKGGLPSATIPIAWTKIKSHLVYEVAVESIRALRASGGGSSAVVKASEGFLEKEENAIHVATQSDLGTSIIDSGTTFSYFPTHAFKAIMSVLESSCSEQTSTFCSPSMTGKSEDLCWTINNPTEFELLPSFIFSLEGGAEVEWKSYSYLARKGTTRSWCVALDDNKSPTTILGMSFMKRQDIIFDRDRDLLGFVDALCPEIHDTNRPPPPSVKRLPKELPSKFPLPSTPLLPHHFHHHSNNDRHHHHQQKGPLMTTTTSLPVIVDEIEAANSGVMPIEAILAKTPPAASHLHTAPGQSVITNPVVSTFISPGQPSGDVVHHFPTMTITANNVANNNINNNNNNIVNHKEGGSRHGQQHHHHTDYRVASTISEAGGTRQNATSDQSRDFAEYVRQYVPGSLATSPPVLWASAGILMALVVMSMGVMVLQSIRSRRAYQPMAATGGLTPTSEDQMELGENDGSEDDDDDEGNYNSGGSHQIHNNNNYHRGSINVISSNSGGLQREQQRLRDSRRESLGDGSLGVMAGGWDTREGFPNPRSANGRAFGIQDDTAGDDVQSLSLSSPSLASPSPIGPSYGGVRSTSADKGGNLWP